MQKTIIITASILGFTGIILGAFGAHGLREILEQPAIDSFKTGVLYQLFHAVFLLFLGILAEKHSGKSIRTIFYLTLFGVVLFSGSIYLLALNEQLGLENFKNTIGPITPIGGLLLILSWFMLMIFAIRHSKN